jgi:hypothetical protein
MVFNIHEVIYYQSIEDPKSVHVNNSALSVTSYPSGVATYNQINIILNYILPFVINLVATIILIVLTTRKRTTATTKQRAHLHSHAKTKSRFRTYMNRLIDKKELIFGTFSYYVTTNFLFASVYSFILISLSKIQN